MTALSDRTAGFGLAAALAALADLALVLLKQTHPAVLAWLARSFGHHWIGHGVLIVGLYAGAGLSLTRAGLGRRVSPTLLFRLLLTAMAVSGGGIALFFALFD
ncbi:hypothetical protein GALL_242040 [mine drainage metagenome]|uniref:Uncharacterized protein n=1 Tax=mine drainage metagenome TaxID=410659 RepID=A0A1J5S0F9_9ZZZZ